ncbi:hypothetical protein QP150_10300 [Sphingomonas sp. 22L2VL55-3]
MSTVAPTLIAASLPPGNSGATTSTWTPSIAIFAAIRVPSGESFGLAMPGSLAKVSTGTRSESVAFAFGAEAGGGAVCATAIVGIIAPASRLVRHVIISPPAIPQRPFAQSIAFGSRHKRRLQRISATPRSMGLSGNCARGALPCYRAGMDGKH